MDVAVMIALGAALWFIYQALLALLAGVSVAEPGRSIVVTVYCIVAAVILLFESGMIGRH